MCKFIISNVFVPKFQEILCLILPKLVGIYEATTLERGRKDSLQKSEISNGMLDDELEMPSLPT